MGPRREWWSIEEAGLRAPDLDKLDCLRIHGVSPDFIGQLQKLGYAHPEADN